MKGINVLALVLVIVGALNWGLVALFEWISSPELFGETFGTTNVATRIILRACRTGRPGDLASDGPAGDPSFRLPPCIPGTANR